MYKIIEFVACIFVFANECACVLTASSVCDLIEVSSTWPGNSEQEGMNVCFVVNVK